MSRMLWQYLLVYCTSHGLRQLGEPPLPKTALPVQNSMFGGFFSATPRTDPINPMPVWLIFIFSILVSLRYLITFLVSLNATLEDKN